MAPGEMQQAYYNQRAKAALWRGPRVKASERDTPIPVDSSPFVYQVNACSVTLRTTALQRGPRKTALPLRHGRNRAPIAPRQGFLLAPPLVLQKRRVRTQSCETEMATNLLRRAAP